MNRFPLTLIALLSCASQGFSATLLVEAESFTSQGGWVVDQQSMDQMGSPYAMAHGLGRPVADAVTTVELPEAGSYRIWVRTRDWVGQWKQPDTTESMLAKGSPGVFQVVLNGKAVAATFGEAGAEWHWQDGGAVKLPAGSLELRLHDLTGFNGRCDAIVLTTNTALVPPNDLASMAPFRRKLLKVSEKPVDKDHYDVVVVGGGIAGICAAISSARHGCRTALIQNRPVLGGNNSSEVRVGLSGLIRKKPYTNLGNLVDEIDPVGHWTLWDANKAPQLPRSKEVFEIIGKHPEKKEHNAGPASNYDDNRKLQAVLAEPNLTLFLNTHVNGATMEGSRIASVIAQNIRTSERMRFNGDLFIDSTGDGNLGVLARADFRVGRESKTETDEGLAPAVEDQLVMGTSMQWTSRRTAKPSPFPASLPWAVKFSDKTCVPTKKGDWNWETGADRDQVKEIEHIRDYALRVIFGNWTVLKNHERFSEEFLNLELSWIAYIGGKRESRRLMGDVVLKQQDIVEQRPFEDASVTTTWTIDLHHPLQPKCACDAFRSRAEHLKITPYPIPYRCLYSRNVNNLMMAGRNISVTHVALGTVRVQRTTGMMGEVLGMAASLCRKHKCLPRGVYMNHLSELKELMTVGVPPLRGPRPAPSARRRYPE
ncbi:MAG: pyridine nucleotide-disulfide oxidoreductase [Roseibacillus sp.]|jgi:hypothetical protein|nr:pyridine nucleotide-disulfide oxidoreductase [Roseibacillus sp.]